MHGSQPKSRVKASDGAVNANERPAAIAAEFKPAESNLVLDATALMVRPIVRLLIAHGVTLTMWVERLKRVFVDVATNQFTHEGARQSDSRLAVLTGVHRKDIKRLREESEGVRAMREPVTNPGLMLMRWTGDMRFMVRGRSKPLPRRKDLAAGEGPSFEDLVESVSKDIPARAILDEWLRLNIVRMDSAGRAVLNREWIMLGEDHATTLNLMAVHGYDRLSAAVENHLASAHLYPVFSVDSRNIDAKDLEEFQVWYRKACAEFLDQCNARLTALEGRSGTNETAGLRISAGAYLYAEPMHGPAGDLRIK